MARKKTTGPEQVIDFFALAQGKEIYNDDPTWFADCEVKKVSVFDIVKDIQKQKSGTMLDKEEGVKAFNLFMVMKSLSSKTHDIVGWKPYINEDGEEKKTPIYSKYPGHQDIFIVNEINQLWREFDNVSAYNFFTVAIPEYGPKEYYPLISKMRSAAESEILARVSHYYECSLQTAKEYVDLNGPEFIKMINDKYGDVEMVKKETV